MEELMAFAARISPAISVGTVIYVWLTAGSKKTATDLSAHKTEINKQLSEIAEDLEDHSSRIQAIEIGMHHLPDRDMVHGLQLTLKDIQIEMAAIKASAEQSTRISRRMEEYLIENSKAGVS